VNLLILTSHFPPSWGGVESQNLDVARYMAAMGHDVDVICISERVGNEKWKDMFSRENINVNYVKNSLDSVTDHAYLIKRFIDSGKKKVNSSEDVIIETHEKESALAATTLKKTSKNHDTKAVWFLHGPDMFCCKNMPLLPTGEFCGGIGKKLREYSKCVKCLSYFKRSRLNIPIQYLTFKATNTLRLEGRVVIMNIGAIIPPWKGFEHLIDAASLVAAQHPAVLFVNLGGLSRRSVFEVYINRLLAKIERLGISKHFLFIPAVPRSEVPTWINSADILAFTSYYDNYHWSLMEALSCRKPIVVTDAGPTREIAVDNYNTLVASLNPKSIAEKTNWLIEDESLRKRISIGARKTAEERDKIKVLPKLERLYLDLVE